jgi:hypothetical protein
VIAIALGATGWAPPFSSGWHARPPCQICRKIRPPAACTASVVRLQPVTWAGEWIPGSIQNAEWFSIAMVASAMINPAVARWA